MNDAHPGTHRRRRRRFWLSIVLPLAAFLLLALLPAPRAEAGG